MDLIFGESAKMYWMAWSGLLLEEHIYSCSNISGEKLFSNKLSIGQMGYNMPYGIS